VLNIGPISKEEIEELIRNLEAQLPKELVDQIITRAVGNPALIHLFAGVARTSGLDALLKVLNGPLYDINEVIPKGKIITGVKPTLIVANQKLIEELRKRPESIFDLPPRKFEEVMAEILDDLGMEVELTQATHDGGRDILAHYDTPVGKILCLVDAKKNRKDRTVGVGLIRQLYGTLNHYKANSAMMVTTSTYSPFARSFQEEHKYELNLREYSDVVKWIDGYKQKSKTGLFLPG